MRSKIRNVDFSLKNGKLRNLLLIFFNCQENESSKYKYSSTNSAFKLEGGVVLSFAIKVHQPVGDRVRTLGVDVIFLKDKSAPVPRGGVGRVAAHPVGQAGRRGRLDGKEGVTASLPDCIDIGKKKQGQMPFRGSRDGPVTLTLS